MRITTFLLFFLLLWTSCGNERKNKDENLLVEVEGNYLYRQELEAVLPQGSSPDDSLLFAEGFIRNWIEEVLFFDKAKTNIPDTEELERLVENYRKVLIIHTYQQALINQRLSSEISEQEIVDFYESNKTIFVLERPLIKGLYIKVPLNAPQISDVHKWYKTETSEAVENLEKYSFQNAVGYEYFYNKWMLLSDVLGKIPLREPEPEEYIKANRHIELKDTAFYYFLNVTDYRDVGDEEPYDFARLEAKDMLLNIKKVDYIKGVKEDLYQDAVRRNNIIYNY